MRRAREPVAAGVHAFDIQVDADVVFGGVDEKSRPAPDCLDRAALEAAAHKACSVVATGKEKPAGVQSEGEVAWGDEPHRLASAE
jgi:hypothetical protein